MINKYKIIFLDQTKWTVLAHFGFLSLNLVDCSSPLWIFKLKSSGLFLEQFGLDFID